MTLEELPAPAGSMRLAARYVLLDVNGGIHGRAEYACPPTVDAYSVLSYLTELLGPMLEPAYTASPEGERMSAGWMFAEAAAERVGLGGVTGCDLLVVPLIDVADGWRPMFDVEREQRDAFIAASESAGIEPILLTAEPQPWRRPGPNQPA
jgi:hypothetical protein